ncbi:serine/arginine repetitive matrix protein 1 isoform X1 [Trichogramma pretiosum]|uniref:serine/arginine repetitive matrix protein 1 isoform X1 n=1 Tax=Trichogramma pretiosum TaxID=7493 RepID=UPI000C71C549|nr:serine/arginine repetitive matrix protein 1 isoform X1 [Trichogramma pretiosum]XP_023317995.1 serine/arginine repetitive matrix protein 1 isoform X1 [Trichogramma pretiosum]
MASRVPSVHQRKLGPAPIASFEDLSDEVENGAASGGESSSVGGRMPGIVEHQQHPPPLAVAHHMLKTPATPRIDISRASSSSVQEEESGSRESTPEKELLAGAAPPEGCQLQLGYKEDCTDLRSSTEELELRDPVHEQDLRREMKRSRRRHRHELHDGTQSEHGVSIKIQQSERERKDSNCSEIILLNISGRTSRLSSVGSQGSAVSDRNLSVSAASSRSPSPHKCLLETSFCGSASTLDNAMIEPVKPDTDDIAKILLLREADSTRALIPENVRLPIVAGNIKPDPLDAPRRRQGREERKEIFRREVEITKKVLKRVNIDVPIIKLPKEAENGAAEATETSLVTQKPPAPATLNLHERRKRSPSTASTSSRNQETPKLQRHEKIRELEGSRTPSPSSVSRKSSFTSLFKGRTEGNASVQDSPTPGSSRRPSLVMRLKDTAENLRSRSKSRERRPSSGCGDRSPSAKRSESRGRLGSGVFSSTLSLFKKRERKKSDGGTRTPDHLNGSNGHLDSLEYQFRTPSRTSQNKEDVIFISLYGENDEFRYKDEYPLPAEDETIKPLEPESPSKIFQDENDDISSPHQATCNIVCTDVTIEHHRKSRLSRDSIRMSTSSGDEVKTLDGHARSSLISKSDSRDSKILTEGKKEFANNFSREGTPPTEEHKEDTKSQRMSTSSSKESMSKRSEASKPRRKSRSSSITKPTSEPPPPPSKVVEINGKAPKVQSPPRQVDEKPKQEELILPAESLKKTPSAASDLDKNSSGSERDAEIEFVKNKGKGERKKEVADELPDEQKGLCYEESFEEDLPYVPTTLPLEKSAAVPILSVKQRLQEVKKTTPIERPRSTTPINPTLLDEYVQHTQQANEHQQRGDKMRISLPREDSFRLKSPHRSSLTGHNSFTEFAERVSAGTRQPGFTKSPSPPPLPPRAPTTRLTTTTVLPSTNVARQQNWINFEEIPEKRKAPKRIQTIPRLDDDRYATGHGSMGQYSYVQPEECRCECHEESRRANSLQRDGARHHHSSGSSSSMVCGNGRSRNSNACNGENCQQQTANPSAVQTAERSNVISDDSSHDGSPSIEYPPGGYPRQHHHRGSKPFEMDLDVSSNRSSIISQDETED